MEAALPAPGTNVVPQVPEPVLHDQLAPPPNDPPLRVNVMFSPRQMLLNGRFEVTLAGAMEGSRTVTVVELEAEGPLHPLAVTLTVAVPVKDGFHVTVPVVLVPEIVFPAPVTLQL